MNQRSHEPDGSGTHADVIQPIKFKPASGARALPRIKLPWAHGLIGIVVLIGLWGAWYVITARSVSIVTEPAESIVNVDELFAPNIQGHWMLRPGPRTVSVEAPGFKRYRDDIVVTDEQLQTHKIKLYPLPGHLRVAVTPVASANLTIDDDVKATVPGLVNDIDAGAREVTVSADRYLEFKTVIEIEGRGIEQQLSVHLKPAWAEMSIQSQPAGATVMVGDKALGVTPLEAEVIQGERTIKLQLDGYKPWKRTVSVIAGTPLELPPILLSKADGYISVKTSPAGASITLDSEFKGRSPLKFAVVPDKPHKIGALKEGYSTSSKVVTAASGVNEEVSLQLAPELAAVQVITTPKDAELFVNGKLRGTANQTIKLPTHAHNIEIRKSGYVTYTGSVTPRKGIRKRISVRLKTPEAAGASAARSKSQPAATKGFITSAAGQQLKLFRGGTIQMGSSRREPGRRANEVLRTAKLKRPFYFGVREVANGEFRRFLANHRAAPIKGIDVNGDKHPVIGVSWESAALFCNWLSRKDALDVFYQITNGKVLGINPTALGYRLPTEAEWAWVARAAPKGSEPFPYPWAGKYPPRGRSGNYADQSAAQILANVIADYNDGFPATAPVGSFAASLRGINDLGGNVSEWMSDFYAPTASGGNEAATDPLGPRSGTTHVIRGSNWSQSSQSELRLAYRDFGNAPRDDVGFRIARYAQ